MRPALEGWREAGCRLTSRQTTMAANIAEREVLMACCQGDTGQPGSVSFADANETLQLPQTLAKPPLETQTESPPPQWAAPAYTWAEKGGEAQLFICFLPLLVMCAFVPCLASFGKEELLRVSKCPTTPTVTSSLLVSSPIPLIVCVELAFSARGMDGSMHCWITALSRRSTPPQRQQKGRLLCLAGGKQLGTDDAGPTDLCGHSYCGDKVLLW